jgi:hypothetical protein
MVWTAAVVLLVLWTLGMISSTTMGGLIHVLLAAALAMVMVRVRIIRGRNPVGEP